MSHSGAFYQPIHSLRTSTLTHWTIRLIVELSSSQWMYSLFEYHCQVSVSLSSICISIIVKYLYQYHCQVSVSVSLSSICISIIVKYLYQYHCQISVSVSLSSICISVIVKYLYQYHCQVSVSVSLSSICISIIVKVSYHVVTRQCTCTALLECDMNVIQME